MWQLAGPWSPLVVAGLLGCGAPTPPGVDAAEATSIALTSAPIAALEIPDTVRPKGPPSEEISLDGNWSYAGKTGKGMHKWSTPIPIRPRGLFFHSPQPGMELRDASGRVLDYDRFGRAEQPFWSYNKTKVIVYFPTKGDPPSAGDFRFTYPKANEREARLNFGTSGLESKEDFIRAQVHNDWETRNG